MSSKLENFYHFSPLRTGERELTKELAKYDIPVHFFDKTTFVGVEIEVEQVFGQKEMYHYDVSTCWRRTNDGSLRAGGVEFVSKPLRGSNVHKAVHLLYSSLSEHQKGHEFSDRCGIHIHVNARKFTADNFISFILTYLAVEDLLYAFVGNNRKDNLYCIPMQDNFFYSVLKTELKRLDLTAVEFGEWFNHIVVQAEKYSAVNFKPLSSFGTIEFRHMAGENDPYKVCKWINIILKIKQYCYKNKAKNVLKRVSSLNSSSEYDLFLMEVFEELAVEFFKFNLIEHMEKGVTKVKEMFAPRKIEFNPESPLGKVLTAKGFIGKPVNFTSRTTIDWRAG